MTQLAIDFDRPAPTAREHGDAGRDAGIATAVARAEADHKEWSKRAFDFVVRYARRGEAFTCPQLRAAAEAEGFPMPPSAFAWGGPMQRASRTGVIRRVGYAQHGDETMHTQGVSLWTAA